MVPKAGYGIKSKHWKKIDPQERSKKITDLIFEAFKEIFLS
jgi:hypothetical protein